MPSNKLYESETFAKDSDQEYAPAANSALLPRRRPMHGKWTAMILGGSVCLNAMLVLYCANMQFMKPLAYDRGQELAYLQMKDRELTAQKLSLERTTQGLMEQKAQLLQHYKETETVGKKLETYKEKLRVDAQEVKDAEAAAELLMQRLATAQGKTISTQQLLTEEQKKLAKAKKELQDETKTTQQQLATEKQKLEKARKELQDVQDEAKNLKKDEKTNKLIRALSWDGKDVSSTERAELCHDCTCVKYC